MTGHKGNSFILLVPGNLNVSRIGAELGLGIGRHGFCNVDRQEFHC